MSKIEEINSNINSLYIMKEILSFINMKRKLSIIIYNKQLKKELGIVVEDYKKLSIKYKVGRRNGIASEYILKTNKLIFTGEYLNAKRNGKGNEYYENGK